jgi:4-amino-4-deoxy-L-arabinose transferase-like glycosyltransferase
MDERASSLPQGRWAKARERAAMLEMAAHWLLALAVAAYVGLAGYNSLTRTRNFSPDSMNYVSVARNIAEGKGITQPALGFNQPHISLEVTLPPPFTSQPPLYPLAVALVGLAVPSHADAALLVSAGCYGLILLIGYRLARRLYGHPEALLGLALLIAHYPLGLVSRFAWSEPLGILLALLSFILLVQSDRSRESLPRLVLAGLCAGLAFAARYLLLPAAAVGAVALLARPGGRRIRRVAAYAAGATVPAALVLGRNLALTGTLMGARPNPSLKSLGENLREAGRALLGQSFESLTPEVAAPVLAVLVLSATILLAARGRGSLGGVLWHQERWLLVVWSFSYLALLILQRSQIHFDSIGPRLVAPASVTLALILGAMVARASGLRAGPLLVLALLVALAGLRREVQLLQLSVQTDAAQVARSGRLSWVVAHTTERDLIVGDDTMDIPFYLDRPLVFSFSPYPYTDHPEYESIAAFARRHANRFDRVYLVLRDRYRADQDWRWAYGDFIADVVSGDTGDYPGVALVQRVRNGYVFEMRGLTEE